MLTSGSRPPQLMRASWRRARRHPHGVDGGHSLGVVAEPEYPRITDVDEQPTTIHVILASDPEIRFDGQPQRRAICTVYGADGSIAVAISDLPEDLERGRRTLAEQLAESTMTGCRTTLTGRWATVQIEDVPDYRHRLGELAERRRMLLVDGFEHPEKHPERANRGQPPRTPPSRTTPGPSSDARVDNPWGWPPDR